MKPWHKVHYQFQNAIAEYWINPELVTSEKESKKMKFEFEIPFPSTFSTISLLSPGTLICTTIATNRSSMQRASRLDNASLDHTGRSSLRLNQSVDHIINEAKNKAKCALDYCTADIIYEVQIVACFS